MLCTTDIKVYISPILVSLCAYKGIVVVRIHITQVVCAAACKTRHCAHLNRISLISPVLGTSERRFTSLCRQELINLRKFERKLVERHRSGDTVLEVHRERLSPISLT